MDVFLVLSSTAILDAGDGCEFADWGGGWVR
jgi:hypothetical protein